MFAILIRGLSLGVSPATLQRCIEESLNERPVFPQTPTISGDEALLYLPSREIQMKITSPNVKLRCSGNLLYVERMNHQQCQEWLHNQNIQNIQKPSELNINANIQQEAYVMTKGGRRAPPVTIDDDYEEMHNSLYGELPRFESMQNPNRIIWYQYLVFVTRFKTPFYVTYPAEWCWDIEGQWLKFQEHYAINPMEAEKVDSRFSIGDPEQRSNNHNMVGDLLNMCVTDSNTGRKYEFKRTYKLIGVLIDYGHIQFERYYEAKECEIFLYDRRTGYGDGITEDTCNVGDRMIFNVWWNKDDNDCYHYDVTQRIASPDMQIRSFRIHFGMFAFNVKPANVKEETELLGLNKVHKAIHGNRYITLESLPVNPILPQRQLQMAEQEQEQEQEQEPEEVEDVVEEFDPTRLRYCDPAIAEDFKGKRFEGLLIALTKEDTGFIVCFPFIQNVNEALTLLFHVQFVQSNDRHRLSVNMCVKFSIAINPIQFGKGAFPYVATDIVICKDEDGFVSHHSIHPLMPVTMAYIERKYRGHVVVAPKTSRNEYGFIYNKFNNNMVILNPQKEAQPDIKAEDYRAGSYVRYNERKQYNVHYDENSNDSSPRNQYCVVAVDVIPVEKVDTAFVKACHTKDAFIKYKAKRYILGGKLKIDRTRNIQYKHIDISRTESTHFTDMHMIVKESEMYLNAFLNSNSGGAVMFGIHDDGLIIGQSTMTSAKREYIRATIRERVKYFDPSVAFNYYSIEFKPIIDMNGYAVVDTYVVIVNVSILRLNREPLQHIKFKTSTGKVYEQHNGRLITTNTKYRSYSYSNSHSNNEKLPSIFSVNPRFVTFHNIDSDNDGDDDEDDDEDDAHAPSHADAYDDAYNDDAYGNDNDNDDYDYKRDGQDSEAELDGENINQSVLEYTTPTLNSKPIPPNTENGRIELSSRVQMKLNEMMNITQYMLDPRWQSILTMSSSHLYNAQKTTWMLMKSLETETIVKNKRKRTMFDNENKGSIVAAGSSDTGALPVLRDKSKYKAIAIEYCQKVGWRRPIESIQLTDNGYRAKVIFGAPTKERSASGDAHRQKNAIYKAYMRLVPIVIPKLSLIQLMNKKQQQSGIQIMKHPKSALLEWAQKNSIAPPVTTFSEYVDPSRGMRIWTAKVSFCGKTVEAHGPKKKDAQSKCFQELLNHVMTGDIEKYSENEMK